MSTTSSLGEHFASSALGPAAVDRCERLESSRTSPRHQSEAPACAHGCALRAPDTVTMGVTARVQAALELRGQRRTTLARLLRSAGGRASPVEHVVRALDSTPRRGTLADTPDRISRAAWRSITCASHESPARADCPGSCSRFDAAALDWADDAGPDVRDGVVRRPDRASDAAEIWLTAAGADAVQMAASDVPQDQREPSRASRGGQHR